MRSFFGIFGQVTRILRSSDVQTKAIGAHAHGMEQSSAVLRSSHQWQVAVDVGTKTGASALASVAAPR
jgi:hypothetical protein